MPNSLSTSATDLGNGLNQISCGSNQYCPDKHTCCPTSARRDHFSCCPQQSGVCCGDYLHCCPKGYSCSKDNLKCSPNNGNGLTLNFSITCGALVFLMLSQSGLLLSYPWTPWTRQLRWVTWLFKSVDSIIHANIVGIRKALRKNVSLIIIINRLMITSHLIIFAVLYLLSAGKTIFYFY